MATKKRNKIKKSSPRTKSVDPNSNLPTPPADDPPSRGALRSNRTGPDLLTSSIFIALLAVFVFAKLPGLRPAVSDENIYFYMATAILRGALPYQDFFYANPPGLLGVLTVVGGLTGSAFWAFKAVPLVSALVSALFLFLILHHRQQETAGEASLSPGQERLRNFCDRAAPLFGVFAFLFSYDHLRASSHCTGLGVTLALIMIGWYLLQRRALVLGGLLLAGACLVKTFGIVAVPPLLLFVFLRGGVGDFKVATASFLIPLVGVYLVCLGIFGEVFWEQTYEYHRAKEARSGENWDVFLSIMGKNLPLTLLGLGCCVGLFNRELQPTADRLVDRLRENALEWSALVFVMVLLAFLAAQPRVFDFYFVVAFPAAAILAVGCLKRILQAALIDEVPLVRVLGLFMALALFIPWTCHDIGEGRRYLCAWGWPRGILGWYEHEQGYFEKGPIIAKVLEERMGPDDRLFGDSVAVPGVAVLGGYRIAGDEADTNTMRFRSGMTDLSVLLAKIDTPRYILLRSRSTAGFSGIGILDDFRDWMMNRYRYVQRWQDGEGYYFLFERVSDGPE